jgi:pimeloyl-ACP methyl ester carboxylesterase
MLDGTDHSAKLSIAPAESIEGRIAHALAYLVKTDPKGDWGYFLEGDKPRWPRIIISGQSFGATSALLIAKHRPVVRAIGLSGPLDGGAAWLKEPSMTPVDRMYAFSQVNDGQHPTHMSSMAAMGLPGSPVEVESSKPPYDNSHRLVGATKMFGGAAVDGHNATEARMQSPKDPTTGKYIYEPVWRYMYGVDQAP